MAEETVKDAPQNADTGQVKEAPPAVGRFRLPKLFAEQAAPPGGDAPDTGTSAPEGVNGSAGSVEGNATPSEENGTGMPGASVTTSSATTSPTTPPLNPQSPAALMLHEIGQLHDGMELIYRSLSDMAERESSREKVFDTLYTELREYKNDFIYEHMKPVVRPLLFLYDSLEQFDREVTEMILPPEAERRQLSPSHVRQNMSYFMDQLVEALRICEVTQMEGVEGVFNPKLHKAVEVAEVEAELDNTIVRIVRHGWYLNGQLLRPAEVVVGKAKS